MIDKRINYRYGGGADMGAGASGMGSGNFGGNTGGDGGNRNTGRDRIQNERAADVRARELANLATQNFGQGDTSRDVFGFRGTFENEGVRGLARQYLSPSNILGGILGLINPFAGFAFRALKNIPNVRNIGQYQNLQDFYQNEIRPSVPVAEPVTMAGQADMMGNLNQFPSLEGGIRNIPMDQPSSVVDVDLIRRLIEQKQMEQ